jgi:hypothetical protein
MLVLWVITPFSIISLFIHFKLMCWLHFWGAWIWFRWTPKRSECSNNWYFLSSQSSVIPTVNSVSMFLWNMRTHLLSCVLMQPRILPSELASWPDTSSCYRNYGVSFMKVLNRFPIDLCSCAAMVWCYLSVQKIKLYNLVWSTKIIHRLNVGALLFVSH